ncbi:hypothetical protein KFL_002620070 [Klebsormidium nitens]|uniref:Uncharacterized protein n=1 Tax=Klebsormidium nitens TaxID=105231 RepID=A0A1Y1I4S1_KLENI|nr:hypothetical protein KFL_002620070 [Klebsormidium nitens]|eukprot:GAQ85940.1 hypothetical protein KFL_002620070 [Klebsormidium nitens]
MESLSPQEVSKLLEAEADTLQQMQSKVEKQLERLKLEEQLILQSASWNMQDQQIAGDEDLAPLPRPLSPLHEAHIDTVSRPDERQAAAWGTVLDNERPIVQEDTGSDSELEKKLKEALEAENFEDSENDEESD